jgi:plastocyanin
MPDLLVRIVPKEGGGSEFDPGSLAVPSLAGVSWENTTGTTHQILLSDSSFETEVILPGEGSTPLYIVPQTATGSIAYSCALHPQDEVGSLVVTAVVNMNE